MCPSWNVKRLHIIITDNQARELRENGYGISKGKHSIQTGNFHLKKDFYIFNQK